MGKKWGWFYAVKKAFISDPTKDKKDLRSRKSKRKWFGRYNTSDHVSSIEENITSINTSASPPIIDDVELVTVEKSNHVYTVALATAAAAAQAAAEAVWLSVIRFSGKSKEETAAIRIQATFRGYMARKTFRAMRGLARLNTSVQGQYVKRQAWTTLRCMQTLARVQSQIRTRRIRMYDENQSLHKQLQQKREKEMDKLNNLGDGWNDSPHSKEQMEARLLSKKEASMRRERALAYAFSHQKAMKNKFLNPLMEPNSSIWGWSWLERWMAARPWEIHNNSGCDGQASPKSATSRAISAGGEMNRPYSCKTSPSTSHLKRPTRIYHSLSAPISCVPFVSLVKGNTNTIDLNGSEESHRSSCNVQSKQHQRRHSTTGFSPSTSSSIGISTSRKARSRPASPLGLENKDRAVEKSSMGPSSAKKRHSFLGSPIGSRRHSGLPS